MFGAIAIAEFLADQFLFSCLPHQWLAHVGQTIMALIFHKNNLIDVLRYRPASRVCAVQHHIKRTSVLHCYSCDEPT